MGRLLPGLRYDLTSSQIQFQLIHVFFSRQTETAGSASIRRQCQMPPSCRLSSSPLLVLTPLWLRRASFVFLYPHTRGCITSKRQRLTSGGKNERAGKFLSSGRSLCVSFCFPSATTAGPLFSTHFDPPKARTGAQAFISLFTASLRRSEDSGVDLERHKLYGHQLN